MPETERARVAKNPYQGDFRRVLCVCSGGILRSPTVAWVLSNPPYNCNTRAAGSETYALVPVDQVLLDWAHDVVFVNPENAMSVRTRLKVRDPWILNIPDSFPYRDSTLVERIQQALERAGFPTAADTRPQSLRW